MKDSTMPVSNATVEILNTLHSARWKSALALMQEVTELCKKERRISALARIIALFSQQWSDLLIEPSIGQVYAVLEKLRSQGLVESRYRDDPPEVLVKRSGRRTMEWRLTQQGFKVRTHCSKEHYGANTAITVPA